MSRITIILNILAVGRVRQPIREPITLDTGFINPHPNRQILACIEPRERDEWVRLAGQDPLDGVPCVVAGRNGATDGFDSLNRRGRGAGDDDLDGLFECFFAATGEEFDTVLDAVDTAGLRKLADCDGTGGVEAALVDPLLDAVEVDFGDVEGEAG